jgi:predicted DNA-binding protein (MmcQ/YjbR family)
MKQAPLDIVRSLAERYPEAEKAFLFGDHEVYRVREKVFVWLGEGESGGTYVSVKLKDTQQAALMLPFVTPSAYGMAKWGWVSADIPKGQFSPELVRQWLDESYRHTAPKKLLAIWTGSAGAATPSAPGPRRSTRPNKGPARRKASKRRKG